MNGLKQECDKSGSDGISEGSGLNENWIYNKYKGIKKTANMARAMIRNLVVDMDDEEKEKLLKDIERDQGF